MFDKVIEIDGRRYMNSSAAGNCWDMTSKMVSTSCGAGLVVGAIKVDRKWLIPIDAKKPLSKGKIREILIAILACKNKGEFEVLPSETMSVLTYLSQIGYINGVKENEQIRAADICLSDAGFRLATTGEGLEINMVEALTKLLDILHTIISIWSTYNSSIKIATHM